MVPGYYNLTEAAKALGMLPDELRQMAQKNQIRSFQDRGTLRFRIADIQELSRRRGATSDPELVLAEPKSGPHAPSAPKSGGPKSPPPSGPKTPPRTPRQQPADAPEVFDFALEAGDDRIDIGKEVLSDSGPKSGPRSGSLSGKKIAPAGSDSDVKLVANSGPDSDVKLVSDSNVKMPGPKSPATPGQRMTGAGPMSPSPKKSSRLVGGAPAADSGVRLTPADSDSDVKIVGPGAGGEEIPLGQQPPPSATDSDIRLEHAPPPSPAGERQMNLTEEINLDEEIKKQEAAQQSRPKSRVKPKSQLKFPTQSPFELSDSDLDAPTEMDEKRPSSSDFDLTPQAVKPESSGSVVLEPSSDDFSLELPEDSAVLGGSGEGQLTGPTSGINLSHPVDAGLSLEEGGKDDIDMSLDAEASSKSLKRQDETDSSSEFELSLDDDAGKGAVDDSSSEFELTLDDSGSDSAILKSSKQLKAGPAAEKDIFETDFEVPALEGESGSEVAALQTSDSDVESSDFDLALDDSDLAVEDESGSQVVALDEEAADEAAETIAGELGEEMVIEEEDEEAVGVGPVREVVREKLIEPAPWGALPTVFMLPCVIVMIVVAIMGFELVQSTAGFKSAGFLTRTLHGLVGSNAR
jgi:hypothetical protein